MLSRQLQMLCEMQKSVLPMHRQWLKISWLMYVFCKMLLAIYQRIPGDDENSDPADDSLPVSLFDRVEEGYGWLPSRQCAVAHRRSRHAQRIKAWECGLYAKEQEFATAKEEETKMVKQLEFAQ